jgi:hydroxyacylglutathione hydrolase
MKKNTTSPIHIHTFTVGQMAENCYVVVDEKSREALIIDPGDEASYIAEQIEKREIKPIAIIATHGHFDHIMAAFELQMIYTIPFMASADDQFLLDRMHETAEHFLGHKIVEMPASITKPLVDGDVISFGDNVLKILSTPGHTPGSMSFYIKGSSALFVGDTIFEGGSVGRTDFSYSSREALGASIKKILALPADTRLLPGHGNETTVKGEKTYHL